VLKHQLIPRGSTKSSAGPATTPRSCSPTATTPPRPKKAQRRAGLPQSVAGDRHRCTGVDAVASAVPIEAANTMATKRRGRTR